MIRIGDNNLISKLRYQPCNDTINENNYELYEEIIPFDYELLTKNEIERNSLDFTMKVNEIEGMLSAYVSHGVLGCNSTMALSKEWWDFGGNRIVISLNSLPVDTAYNESGKDLLDWIS